MPQTLSKIHTIPQHIAMEEELHPEATGDFTSLLNDLTLAIRIISRDVRRAGLNDILGMTDNKNIHGENVRKLDEYSNEVIKRAMTKRGHICAMASEEDSEIIIVNDQINGERGKYILLHDPLDGSSNIDVNVTIGTIFSIFKRLNTDAEIPATKEDVLQAGYKQVSAGYALYGSSTNMVYTTGHGVHIFTFDPTIGEFLLTKENIKMPNKGKSYSINEGNYYKWDDSLRQYIDYLKTPSTDKTRPYSLRYIGSLVADIHRTLLNGGIFVYPGDSTQPEGKLRLMYEANPMAMIIEQAGGRATNGKQRILEIEPEEVHERVPLIIGSKEDVFEAEEFIKGSHPYQKMI